jgi:Restriction endonuclease
MQKQLRKPANWQDFETLCKKLWGEIWRVPDEIKKNGRPGQAQAGVDVYAIPTGKTEFWGIQCKGKDDYTNARLSREEIDSELEKSRTFTPQLEGLIFATTANKDAVIEQYVRELDVASRQASGPKILLFCWEDIADLIEENRATYNWYILEHKFIGNHEAAFGFQDEAGNLCKEIAIRPKFIRKIKVYELDASIAPPQMQQFVIEGRPVRYMPPSMIPEALRRMLKPAMAYNNLFGAQLSRSDRNQAIREVKLFMANTGSQVIEDWKVRVDFEGHFRVLANSLYGAIGGGMAALTLPSPGSWQSGNQVGFSSPTNKPLVQHDTREFSAYIAPHSKEYDIPVKWSLHARDYSASGDLLLHIHPEYQNKFEVETVYSVDELQQPVVLSVEEKHA